jgi:ABC-type phosphate transport system permease subunit
MGVFLKRPMISGLFFLYGWELLLARMPGWAPRFTLTVWLSSLLHHRPSGEGIGDAFSRALPPGLSLVVLPVIIGVCLALAAGIFARRQYVLEQ